MWISISPVQGGSCQLVIIMIIIIIIIIMIMITRSYAALRAADLDWIVGPGYSLGGYILEKNHRKPTWNHEKQ